MEAQLTNFLLGRQILAFNKASQKAFIEVNEEGAVAAAANRKLFIFFLTK